MENGEYGDDIVLTSLADAERELEDEWVGLAEFEERDPVAARVVVSFESDADRDAFLVAIGATPSLIHKKTGPTWSLWWPLREREDLASLRFDGEVPGQLGIEAS